jgi:hypothetical protein
MLDRAGRLQLPADYTQALGMRGPWACATAWHRKWRPAAFGVRPDDSGQG